MGEERGNFHLYLASFASPYQFPSSVFYSPEAEGGKGISDIHMCAGNGGTCVHEFPKKMCAHGGVSSAERGEETAPPTRFSPENRILLERENNTVATFTGEGGVGSPTVGSFRGFILSLKTEEGGEDGYLANKQTEEEEPPSPPRRRRKGGLNLERVFPM